MDIETSCTGSFTNPELQRYVADQLSRDSAILKESRRKRPIWPQLGTLRDAALSNELTCSLAVGFQPRWPGRSSAARLDGHFFPDPSDPFDGSGAGCLSTVTPSCKKKVVREMSDSIAVVTAMRGTDVASSARRT